MPARILKAREEGGQFVVAIWLDDAHVVYPLVEGIDDDGRPVTRPSAEPSPDPEWVFQREWVLDQDPETSVRETVLLAAQELERRRPPESVPHGAEGRVLDLEAVAKGAQGP